MIRRAIFLLSLASTATAAQVPALKPASLDWANLRVVIVPDSDGTWLWANTGQIGPRAPFRSFAAHFVPTELTDWIGEARALLNLPLADSDTGDFRSTSELKPLVAGRMSVFRRRVQSQWTAERFLAMQQNDSTDPVVVNGSIQYITEIIDSLEAVNRRAPVVRLRDVARQFDRHARVRPRTPPAPYPIGARRADREGVVLLVFVVGADGRIDPSTVIVVHSSGADFTESVLDHLSKMAFDPAESGGVPVRERVVMPFTFHLVRSPAPPLQSR